MARLSQAPDPSFTTPLSSRVRKPAARDQPHMTSSPPLRPLSFDTGLQSHGNGNLPDSPPRHGSSGPSLSPADCRTLEKILRNVASSPATPSPLEQGDQLFPDGGRAGTTDTAYEGDGYHFVGGEATDTGYEDEDDSMELSDGGETVTDQVVSSLGEPASPSVSKSERRLQESVSLHDEKEKMRYSSGRRSSTAKPTKPKRAQKGRTRSRDVRAGDNVEDVMNLPGKCAQPAHSLDVGHPDSDRRAVPSDIKKSNRNCSSLQEVSGQEHPEQEPEISEEVPEVLTAPGPQGQALDDGKSVLDDFAANDEQTQPSFSLGISDAPTRKISQSSASKSAEEYSLIVSQFAAETFVQVPSTPTTMPANQTPESVHLQSATNQTVPETPFTKTLSYFKQYKGVENSISARRRNTALPKELAEAAEDVAEIGVKANDMQHGIAHPEVELAYVSMGTSALEDLQAMVQPDESTDVAGAAVQQEDDYVQVIAVERQAVDECEVAAESATSDDKKQVILYPQEPAFINAISMIPATMFWVTAAPVVKYTGIAVELLIDQLRDAFL